MVAGPAQDVFHIGDDVAMRRDGGDEGSGGHPNSVGSDSRRRYTMKRESHEARDEQSSAAERHVSRRIFGKTTAQERATTQETLDGSRERTMRIANVENSPLNWVSISSAGALDMTHCDFSVRSARDETRHMIGSSEPDVVIGSDKNHNRRCRRTDKDHTEFLFELYEAQVARGRYFVHELTSEVKSRMKCVVNIMAMRGDKNGSGGSVHVRVGRVRQRRTRVCQRKRADDHERVASRSAAAKQMHEHASTRSDQHEQRNREGRTNRNMGAPSLLEQWRNT